MPAIPSKMAEMHDWLDDRQLLPRRSSEPPRW
jgi:hypothetical protein